MISKSTHFFRTLSLIHFNAYFVSAERMEIDRIIITMRASLNSLHTNNLTKVTMPLLFHIPTSTSSPSPRARIITLEIKCGVKWDPGTLFGGRL